MYLWKVAMISRSGIIDYVRSNHRITTLIKGRNTARTSFSRQRHLPGEFPARRRFSVSTAAVMS